MDARGQETSSCRLVSERRALETLLVELSIPAWVTTTLPEEKDHTKNNPDKKGEEEFKSE